MPAPRELRQRIRSIGSTKQITKAMELISAARLRKASETTLANRPYAEQLERTVARILTSSTERDVTHPLLEEQKVIKSTLLIVIASDRGQAGAYNSNVAKLALRFIKEEESKGRQVVCISLGKKADHALQIAGAHILQQFPLPSGQPTMEDLHALYSYAVERFREGSVDQVKMIYTHFHSMLRQEAVLDSLIPLQAPEAEQNTTGELIFEPDAFTLLSELLPYMVEVKLYHAVLEATASEHSARRMAMKSATDNANSIIDKLTLTYNGLRQSAITQEIAEITSGAAALE